MYTCVWAYIFIMHFSVWYCKMFWETYFGWSWSLNKSNVILVTHVVICAFFFFFFVPLCSVGPDFVTPLILPIASLNLDKRFSSWHTRPWTGTGSGRRALELRYWYSWVTWPQRWKCLLIVSIVLINVSYYDYQNSKYRIVFTNYSSYINTSALWKTVYKFNLTLSYCGA